MTARDEVVTLLEEAFAENFVDANVMPFSRDVDGLPKKTVMVRIDEVRPSPLANIVRTYNFALLAMVPLTTPGTSDAALDDFLEEVLQALEGSVVANNIVWNLATRATYGTADVPNKYPAYQVDISVHFN